MFIYFLKRRLNFLKVLFLLLPFEILLSNVKAQDTLNLQSAISSALEKNHSVQVAKNNEAVAKNNNHPGNAGFYPKLDINGNLNYENQNSRIEFADPRQPPIDVSNAETNIAGGSLELSYNLFQGLGKLYRYNKLEKESKEARFQARFNIENTLMQVMRNYYQVARAQEQYNVARKNVIISKERYQRIEAKYQFGGGSRVKVLNARVDLDSDSINMINAKNNYDKAKRNLNVMLGKDDIADTNYIVNKSVRFEDNLSIDELIADAMAYNSNIRAANVQLDISMYNKKIAKADQYPALNLSTSYNYSRNESESSFTSLRENNGFSGGLSLTFNIFDGWQKKIKKQNASIALDSRREKLQEIKKQVKRDIHNVYHEYKNSLRILKKNRRNVKNAKLNFEKSKQAYQLGQINSTQYREAQLNLKRAKIRLTNSRLDAKVAELNLIRLSGNMMDEYQNRELN